MPEAGRHLVIGWLGFEDTRTLAAKGGISGVFLTRISRNTGAGIMLGHVRVMSLDPQHPASCSSAVMRGLLREQWGATGLIVTDDFSMTPIFHGPGGIVRATRTSMAAGVDLILLSYDSEAVYDLLAAELADAPAR